MKHYLQKLSEALFNQLSADEELALNLHSEESDFVRFNHAKVRQNTFINQHELSLQFQKNKRSYKSTLSLTLDYTTDLDQCSEKIKSLRAELSEIEENPKFAPLENNGSSEVYKKSEKPSTEEFIKFVTESFKDIDLAGLYCSGPIRQASINSKGQFHYFENDQFFFDYSIYDGPKAAKSFYSEDVWNSSDFLSQSNQAKNTLALLKKPQMQLKPMSYRAYLDPMAVAEIVSMFNWRALSRSAYEQGFAPLKKLFLNEAKLSPKFSLIENNELGLNSHFNLSGELSPSKLPLIEEGILKNFLVNSATAREYNIPSNHAESGLWSSETMRSAEIRAGTLKNSEILSKLGTGLYLSNLHYINWSDPQSARITGMTRFACFWVENGEIVAPIQDLRFDDSLYSIFGDSLEELTDFCHVFVNNSTYQKRSLGGMKVPGMLLNKMNFTL